MSVTLPPTGPDAGSADDAVADTAIPDTGSAERRGAERRESDRRRVERAVWQGALGLLVGILALIAALLLGWRQISLERALERERGMGQVTARDLELIRAQLHELDARAADARRTLEKLAPLPAQVDSTGARLASIEARIDAPQRAVARVEAAHLVELALFRLRSERDVAGATALFEAADARLAAPGDPALFRVRAQLARDLATLRGAPAPDVRGIVGRLSRIEERIDALAMLGTIKNEYVPPGERPAPGPGAARAWQQFSTALRDLVSVRRVSDAAVELVSIEEIGVRRHHLETLVYAARLAALRGDQDEYAGGLHEARGWLERYFDARDPAVRAVGDELAALEALPVATALPDVEGSLRALRAGAP